MAGCTPGDRSGKSMPVGGRPEAVVRPGTDVVQAMCSHGVVRAAQQRHNLSQPQVLELRALLRAQDRRMATRVAHIVSAYTMALRRAAAHEVATAHGPPTPDCTSWCRAAQPRPVQPAQPAAVVVRPPLQAVHEHSTADVAEVERLLDSFTSEQA